MSESPNAVPLIKAAQEMVSALCSGERRWRMSIPVQANDPDLVISRALVAAKDEIKRLNVALASIASNTCCDRCQEAALVAKAALSEQGAAE